MSDALSTLEGAGTAGGVPNLSARRDEGWLELTLSALRYTGFAVVEDVLDPDHVADLRAAMYRTRDRIHADIGHERLERAGELGILRLMLRYDDAFLSLLEVPEVLQVVDATVSPTAILHLQNGFILPSFAEGEVPQTFQNSFHRDFPRHLDGYLASVNTLFALDAFTAENGGTLVVPGTHQRAEAPPREYLDRHAVPVTCPPGSMIVFDSTLWHAAGANVSGADRVGINQQYTRSFIKQQIDYVRALGDEKVLEQRPRTQQLLGWYTRVVTALDEYYVPAERRLYRSGQG